MYVESETAAVYRLMVYIYIYIYVTQKSCKGKMHMTHMKSLKQCGLPVTTNMVLCQLKHF